LSFSERIYLQLQLELGFKAAAIAALKREPSTVGCELRRNGLMQSQRCPECRAGQLPVRLVGYGGRQSPRQPQSLLDCGYTQAHISGAGSRPTLHEAIYQVIYAMPRGELRSKVIALLRHGHYKLRPRARGHDLRGQIPNMVPISERPERSKSGSSPDTGRATPSRESTIARPSARWSSAPRCSPCWPR